MTGADPSPPGARSGGWTVKRLVTLGVALLVLYALLWAAQRLLGLTLPLPLAGGLAFLLNVALALIALIIVVRLVRDRRH
jgi:hypothetical protein